MRTPDTYLLTAIFATILATLTFTACGSEEAEGPTVDTEHADYNNANTGREGASYVMTETGTNSAKFADRIETPRLQAGDVFIVHQVTDMAGNPVNYSAAYIPTQHHSHWIAFRFDDTMKGRSVARKDYAIRPQYPQDPLCKATSASDASFSGYDHGHLCASADRLCSRAANDQTFYMSNMSPQLGSFNQDYWTKYESFVQNLARNVGKVSGTNTSFADTLYVVKGGAIAGSKTTIKVESYQMPIPSHYFIALLSVKNGRYSAIGFWMEHRAYSNSAIRNDNAEIAAHAVSIDDLEIRTGIDFFCNLPGAVEKAVESTFSTSVWGL